MKTTKHITKLSEAFANEEYKWHIDYYAKHLPEYLQNEIERKEIFIKDYINDYERQLTQIKNALIKGNYYTCVNSVSKSGMSRNITIAYIYRNKLITIRNPKILELAGVSKKGRIGGCGMDMLFHAQYTLFQNLHKSYKQAHYQKRMAQYNTI